MLTLAQNPNSDLTLLWDEATATFALRSPSDADGDTMTGDDEALADALRDFGWTTPSPDVTVAWLVDRWCDRRALDALRHILAAWPNFGLTDGYADLADALARVRSLARPDLGQVEEELVGIAEATIRTMLERRR